MYLKTTNGTEKKILRQSLKNLNNQLNLIPFIV
jgi:hypothetical protein